MYASKPPLEIVSIVASLISAFHKVYNATTAFPDCSPSSAVAAFSALSFHQLLPPLKTFSPTEGAEVIICPEILGAADDS